MSAFAALLCALVLRYGRFLASRDDTLAFVGVVGIALVAGFVDQEPDRRFPVPQQREGILWRSDAMLLGYGVRRERELSRRRSADGGAARCLR